MGSIPADWPRRLSAVAAASSRCAREVAPAPVSPAGCSWVAWSVGCEGAVDRQGIAEQVQCRAVLAYRRGELLLTLGVSGPVNPASTRIADEPGRRLSSNPKKWRMSVAVSGDCERVELEAQVLGPAVVGDGLTGPAQSDR